MCKLLSPSLKASAGALTLYKTMSHIKIAAILKGASVLRTRDARHSSAVHSVNPSVGDRCWCLKTGCRSLFLWTSVTCHRITLNVQFRTGAITGWRTVPDNLPNGRRDWEVRSTSVKSILTAALTMRVTCALPYTAILYVFWPCRLEYPPRISKT